MNEEIAQLKEAEKTNHEGTAEEMSAVAQTNARNRAVEHRNTWLWGIGLVVVGGAMLLANLTGYHLYNWWAFFIMLPAFGMLGNAVTGYRQKGRLTNDERSKVAWGLVWLTVACFFLFNLDWETWWPLLLIIGGGAALVTNLWQQAA